MFSSTVSKILLSQFSRNRHCVFFNAIDCYIILKGNLLTNTWASQQHKYFKHGDRELVARKKMTLRQVVTAKLTQKGMYLLKKPIANVQMTIMSNFM